MSNTEKPKWWRDLPATAEITLTKGELLQIIDSAVGMGRSHWDGYYGHDNEFHTAQIIAECPEWKDRFK